MSKCLPRFISCSLPPPLITTQHQTSERVMKPVRGPVVSNEWVSFYHSASDSQCFHLMASRQQHQFNLIMSFKPSMLIPTVPTTTSKHVGPLSRVEMTKKKTPQLQPYRLNIVSMSLICLRENSLNSV